MSDQKIKFFSLLMIFLLLQTGVLTSLAQEAINTRNYYYNPISSQSTLKIVVSNSIIENIVESISGSDVTVIVTGAEDPHSYEPSTSEVSALEDADIVFRLGLEHVEPWWKTEWEDAVVVSLVKDSMLKEDPLLSEHEHAHESYIDLSEEDHVVNPHVWMDPSNIQSFADDILNTIVSHDPINSVIYTANAGSYKSMLSGLLSEIETAKSHFAGTPVVVNHPAFFYLFELLAIERVATIEQGEGKEPSAEDIAHILDEMEEHNVTLIIANPQHESDNVYEIARSSGAKIALLTPLLNVEVNWDGQTKTISTYEDMIKYDLWALGNPVDPPSVLDYWPIFLIIGIIILAIVAIFIYLRRK